MYSCSAWHRDVFRIAGFLAVKSTGQPVETHYQRVGNVVLMFSLLLPWTKGRKCEVVKEWRHYDAHFRTWTRTLFIWPVQHTTDMDRDTWLHNTQLYKYIGRLNMMTSSNGNIFRVTGPLSGGFTAHWWILLTMASDAELWYFLWSTPQQTVE